MYEIAFLLMGYGLGVVEYGNYFPGLLFFGLGLMLMIVPIAREMYDKRKETRYSR